MFQHNPSPNKPHAEPMIEDPEIVKAKITEAGERRKKLDAHEAALAKAVGSFVRMARTGRFLRVNTVCARAGISYAVLSSIEFGRSLPSAELFDKVMAAVRAGDE